MISLELYREARKTIRTEGEAGKILSSNKKD
jgi:hypothetical protein